MSGDGNSYDGRIWCRDEDRDRVNDLKRGGETQADVLERVLDFYDEHDPSDAPSGNVDHGPDVDALADAVADRVGPVISEVIWDTLDADELAQQTAAYVDGADTAEIAKSTADEVAERIDVSGASADDVRAAAERGAENALQGVR